MTFHALTTHQMPTSIDPLPAHASSRLLLPNAPSTSSVIYSTAYDPFMLDDSSSTPIESFFLPEYGPTTAGHEFGDLGSSPTGSGQSLGHRAWSSAEKSSERLLLPHCTFPVHQTCGQAIGEMTALPPRSRDDSRLLSSLKADCPSLSEKEQSLRKQRVAKECVRRKKMSKWFSRLEVLLPQEDIVKFDRCSVLDTAINYIRSMEKTIAETSQSNKRQKLETSDKQGKQRNSSCISTSSPGPVIQEQGVRQIAVSVSSTSKNTFVNAVSCETDPTHFSSLLSKLREHRLDVISASLARSGQTIAYSAHAEGVFADP